MSDSNNALAPRKKAEHIGLKAPLPSASGANDERLDLAALWATVKRSKWVILATCVLVTSLAAGITMVLPKVYESTAVVSIEDEPAERGLNPMMAGWTGMRDLETEIGVLENSGELSRRVIETVRAVADTTQDIPFTLLATNEDGTSLTPYEEVLRLQEMVAFEAEPQQGLILVSVQSESAGEAALIANVFVQEYRAFSREMARSGVVAARDFLEGQLEKRKADIRDIEREWEAFAQSNAVATDGLDGQNVAQEYADLQTQRDKLTFELEQEKRALALFEEQMEKVQPGLRKSVLDEQKVQSLRTQIQALENQIAELKARSEQYYINDPSLRGNESRVRELADMKRRIEGFEARKVDLTEELVEASRATADLGMTAPANAVGAPSGSIGQLGSLRARIEEQKMTISRIEAQIRAIDTRIESFQGRLANIPRQTIQREQLDRRLAQAEQFYKDIAMELQRTIVTEESELGYVQIMRSAVVPMFPVRPNLKQNVILGVLLGLGLGMGLAFVRQSMNWQIYEPDDIQTEGYSLVGVIPKMDREIKKAFKGQDTVEVEGRQLSTTLFPLLNPWSPITENYRLVRANLQFASANGQENGAAARRLLMVTSPEPGDGKTTTAVNLGIAMALSGRKVLLVDADMRRPQVHKMLGLERGPGLADVLTGSRPVDCVQGTIVSNLTCLTAGTPNVPPTELLDTERMRTLLDESIDRFDVVILDTPPVLAATDPVVVAPSCDAILVVASADKTDFRALSQVKNTLEAVGVPIGGVIFNGYDAEKASRSYKYGYGYDYKYDYSPTA
jgi:capsular exopolysaccharide synthesis family protein